MRFFKRWRTRILLFFAVVGPGFITANVDNDANGIVTYSQAGAQFGYQLLWTMIPVTLALIVVQEISARMGAVTGKGLSDLIREEFGFRITFFMMAAILFINFGNILGEFAGIAGSLELFGLCPSAKHKDSVNQVLRNAGLGNLKSGHIGVEITLSVNQIPVRGHSDPPLPPPPRSPSARSRKTTAW